MIHAKNKASMNILLSWRRMAFHPKTTGWTSQLKTSFFATLILLLSLCATESFAATFTVSNTNDSGVGSLRQAILDANSTAGADVIDFSVSGAIVPATALPLITEEVLIDGSGQSVQIDFGGGTSQFVLTLDGASGSTIQNLDLSFSGASPEGFGIRILSSTDVTVQNCTINNRLKGIFVQIGGDVQILNNDLTNSANTAFGQTNYAIELNGLSSTTLPGGVLVAGNTFGNSVNGVRIQGMDDLVISNSSSPVSGTNVEINGMASITSAALVLADVNNYLIDGVDASATTVGGNGIWITSGDDTHSGTIRNCVINNRNSGIIVSGGTDITIENNDVSSSGSGIGYAINVSGLTSTVLTGGVDVSGNIFGTSLRGIIFSNMSNLTISDGSVSGTNIALSGFSTVNFPFQLTNISNLVIDGLDASANLGIGNQGSGISISNSSDVLIQNCVVNNRTTGIFVNGGTDATIVNNNLDASGLGAGHAISLGGVTGSVLTGGVSISGNTFVGSLRAARFEGMSDLTISDGSVSGTNVSLTGLTGCGFPVELNNVSNSLVEALDVSAASPGTGFGFIVQNCNTITLQNNNASSRLLGMSVDFGSDIQILNNDVSNTTARGFNIYNLTAGTLTGGILLSGNTFTGAKALVQMANMSDLTISDGSVSGTNISLPNYDGGNGILVDLSGVSNSTVDGLDLSAATAGQGVGMNLANCTNLGIQNCSVADRSRGIVINGGSDYTIQNNDFTNAAATNLFALDMIDITSGSLTSGVSISGNTFASGHGGLRISNLTDLTISDGSVSGTNVSIIGLASIVNPLVLINCSNSVVDGLDFSSASSGTGGGLSLDQCSNVNVQNCIFNDRNIGIDVTTSGSNLTISCSQFTNNSTAGLWAGNTTDNTTSLTMIDNEISGNGDGIINNSDQTTVTAIDNYWGASDGPGSPLSGSGDTYQITNGGTITASPFQSGLPICLGGSPPGLFFVVGTENSGPNNTVIVPITVNGFTGIANYQGTIIFDPAVLTFVSATNVIPGSSTNNSAFGAPGTGNVPANAITFSWYEPGLGNETLTDGTVVMNLEFTVNSTAPTGFTDVQIDGSSTALGYSTDLNATTLEDPTVTQGGVDIDADAPTVITQPFTVQLDVNGDGSITVDDIDNGSFDASGIDTRSLDITDFDCADVANSPITVTLTVTDIYGNSATGTALVTVEDNIAPVVTTQAYTAQLDASGNATIAVADVEASSSDACGIDTKVLDITSVDCSDVGTPVTVSLTVTDVNGNATTETATVTVEDNVGPAVTTQPFTVQLDAAGNGSITVADVEVSSTDACGIDTKVLDITSFTCADVANSPITVSLTVTDIHGNPTTETALVTVEDNIAPDVSTQPYTAQLDASGNATITADDIDNGSSDACGIDTRVLDISSFDCNDVANSPITVTMTVTDVNGNVATGTALVTVLDDPIISITGQATYASVAADVIPGVIWDLAGDDGPLTQNAPGVGNPGPYGYDFLLSPCGSTNDIGADKQDDDATNNGVDISDAFAIVQHLLLINQFTDPYKLIAADVNATQSINILDAFQVLRKVVFARDYFTNPVTGVDDAIWTFIPSDYVFPNPASPYGFPTRRDYNSPTADAANQDFVGVKLGDVNESWNPGVLRPEIPVDSFYFEMDEAVAMPGGLITIPVRVKDFDLITGYQFTMRWDASVLSLQGINDQALEGVYNQSKASQGILSAAWVDFAGQSVTLDDGTVAFDLVFDVVGEAGSETSFAFTSDLTPNKAYDVASNLLGVGLSSSPVSVGGTTSIDPQFEGYSFLQNVPNPFGQQTEMSFSLGQSEEVVLSIYNLAGQEVRRFAGKYPAGEHKIMWNGRNESGMEVSDGIYMVRMTAGKFVSALRVQKMR